VAVCAQNRIITNSFVHMLPECFPFSCILAVAVQSIIIFIYLVFTFRRLVSNPGFNFTELSYRLNSPALVSGSGHPHMVTPVVDFVQLQSILASVTITNGSGFNTDICF